ncbi:carboxylesterase type B [Catenulispora sp. GAS73]|uniref:hypothetical protein n=1 Tax=Catenulispora sp. GAS73 TaxID=3156269 RepID=UPI003518AE16
MWPVAQPLTTLSDHMMNAWSAFARTGHSGGPTYTPATRTTNVWNVPERVENGPREAERSMWDGFSFPAWDLEPWSRALAKG